MPDLGVGEVLSYEGLDGREVLDGQGVQEGEVLGGVGHEVRAAARDGAADEGPLGAAVQVVGDLHELVVAA